MRLLLILLSLQIRSLYPIFGSVHGVCVIHFFDFIVRGILYVAARRTLWAGWRATSVSSAVIENN